MVILDTHIWFWWVAAPELLTPSQRKFLEDFDGPLAVSLISLWEISLLESKNRISLPYAIAEWFDLALQESGIEVLDLTRDIIIESNQLPEPFHRDPADRIIVACSRVLDIRVVTSDSKIKLYPHVRKLVD
jgi:PIN domain nuclease of toxin-antitoxin system